MLAKLLLVIKNILWPVILLQTKVSGKSVYYVPVGRRNKVKIYAHYTTTNSSSQPLKIVQLVEALVVVFII